MDATIKELNRIVSTYIGRNGLTSAGLLLEQLMRVTADGTTREKNDLIHALEVCKMLDNLHLPLPVQEKDTLLTAVLLHVCPEKRGAWPASPETVALSERLIPGRNLTAEEQEEFYARAQEDRLALLAVLADRSILVQRLHRYSTWNAHRYIEETKAYYYPMAIYGMEHYHELLAPINMLLEKIRTLLEVADILLRRYEVRETEMMRDIMAIREENAVLKGILAKFRGE